MEEREFEILSRYVDGDLGVGEKAAFEELIGGQPDMQTALEDLLLMKARVRQLARDEEPPQTLDALVRPLRRGGRPPLRQSSLVPLAAAAAVVVLALALGLEIGRHGPLPVPADPAGRPTAFALKSLPEADGSSLVGALEHLMAMPYPEPEMLEPEAMEVIGPLPAPPEYYRQALALEVGSHRLPLATGDYPVGLEVEVSVKRGQLVGCWAVTEGDSRSRDLCSAITGAPFVGIEDGDHRAKVVIAR